MFLNLKDNLNYFNGVEGHIHILSSLHPAICLSDFVKDIKTSSSKWIKENKIIYNFSNWQDGYGAFTHSINDKKDMFEYIINQGEYHKKVSFHDEFKKILIAAGVEFDEKYFD